VRVCKGEQILTPHPAGRESRVVSSCFVGSRPGGGSCLSRLVPKHSSHACFFEHRRWRQWQWRDKPRTNAAGSPRISYAHRSYWHIFNEGAEHQRGTAPSANHEKKCRFETPWTIAGAEALGRILSWRPFYVTKKQVPLSIRACVACWAGGRGGRGFKPRQPMVPGMG
jgi:hypothetical protein